MNPPAAVLTMRAPGVQLPSDSVFERWATDGLVWLPERGMGRLVVTEAPYDAAYFEKYQRYAATEMGRKITAARVALVNRYTSRHVVDVGIGCGDFLTARAGWTWGYDVNPAGIAWLHSVGRWCDPYVGPVEAVSLWDVLEHIPYPAALLANVTRHVFVSLPIVPGNHAPPPPHWRHLRRDEHAWYWNHDGLVAWMREWGFEMLEANRMETELGRSEIGTYVFQRENDHG